MKKTAFLMSLVLAVAVSRAYSGISNYTITPDSIYHHIAVLADDSLEGRQVGEPGAWKAATYIQHVFKTSGLEPKGTDGYLQNFEFLKRVDFGPGNKLTVNGLPLTLKEEYEPLKQSASMPFSFDQVVDVGFGIVTDTSDGIYDDYDGKEVQGKAVLIRRYAPSTDKNPHVSFDKYSGITDKINTAVAHKVGAVIFITPSDQSDSLSTWNLANITPKEIPILFLRRQGLKRLKLDLDKPAIESLQGDVQLVKVHDTAYNVVAYLPGKTDTAIIIGAHYDHLGWGGPTSMYHGPVKQIHNGADDNASGVSALLELARYFKNAPDQLKYSIVFIAFTGEEAGLLGSSYYAKHMTIDSSKVRMMINMDMIGRLKDQENGLMILGTGTCEQFKNYFDSLKYDNIKLTFRESGIGPSDHTAFYNQDIPVLYFFTGPHEDYHKPTDDVDKIDSPGIVKVTHIVRDIVTHFDQYDGPLVFQKTKDPSAGKRRAQFSVTLGVMPDYSAQVKGLKIDGIVPDRPGEKAGIEKGDIIVKMRDLNIGDIYDYMNALSKFKKGDSIDIVVDRQGQLLTLPVKF